MKLVALIRQPLSIAAVAAFLATACSSSPTAAEDSLAACEQFSRTSGCDSGCRGYQNEVCSHRPYFTCLSDYFPNTGLCSETARWLDATATCQTLLPTSEREASGNCPDLNGYIFPGYDGGASTLDAGTPILDAGSAGETCEAAQTINASFLDYARNGNTSGHTNNYSPNCVGFETPGPDFVYEIIIPSGQLLTVSASPVRTTTRHQFDLALYLIRGPASNCRGNDGGTAVSCLSASDNTVNYDATETVTWRNTDATDSNVYIIIDSYLGALLDEADGGLGGAHEGAFILTTSVRP